MSTLNHDLSNVKIKINACTDVTGYGLLGHLNEMCNNKNLSALINFNEIPFIESVSDFALKGTIPGGTKNNLEFYKPNILFDETIKDYQKLMLADAQTSGGLLISTSQKNSKILLDYLNLNSIYQSKVIGRFIEKKETNIIVNNE